MLKFQPTNLQRKGPHYFILLINFYLDQHYDGFDRIFNTS